MTMPEQVRNKEHRLPLNLHISALFTLLLLLAGGALGLFNYRQNTAIIFSSSTALLSQIQQNVQRDVSATFQPIRHLLGVLAFAKGVLETDLQARLPLLQPFAQALHDNPKISSIYVGYPNGDFLMLRALRNQTTKQLFDAPANASFQLWSIEQSADGRLGQHRYYDAALNLIEQRMLGTQTFDPREREWFLHAPQPNETSITQPYVFFSTGAVGTTLSRTVAGQATIAADLTLEDLSTTLVKHRVSPSSEVILYDPSGSAVAYPDSRRLIVASAAPRRATVSELLPELAPALAALTDTAQAQGVEELHKRRWIIARNHIEEGGPTGLYLALMVPEDELLADAYRIRWQSSLIILTALFLCLPLGWLISRSITTPLALLVHQAKAMHCFDFAAKHAIRSPVLEVDRLAELMSQISHSLKRFQWICNELGQQPGSKALLQWVLLQTAAAVQAQASIAYLLKEGELWPCCVDFNDHAPRLQSDGLRHPQLDGDLPDWLRRTLQDGTALLSLGFDQAGDLQPLLSNLGSPRVELLGLALHSREGALLGVVALLQNEQRLLEGHTSLHSDHCVAFCKAVARITAAQLQRLHGTP
jgi:hypothetical protein